jgi:hypothetical protein
MNKLLYKPVGMLAGTLAGLAAGVIFNQTWKLVAGEDAPRATDERRSWREVLLAAAFEGAIFSIVRAAVDRGTAEGTRKLTGAWPGDEAEPSGGEA